VLELPEMVTLAKQMTEASAGDPIISVTIAPDRPKFLFLHPEPEAFIERLVGRTILNATHAGKWVLARLENGERLCLGEMFGRILYVPAGDASPKKVHVTIAFASGAALAITIQAWGGVQVLTDRELAEHPYARVNLPDPTSAAFTREHFERVLDDRHAWNRKPIKAFLVHEGNVPGIGNGMLQDILFRARLSPKRKVPDIAPAERERLYGSIVHTIADAVLLGGRDTEKDLYGNPGKYVARMDRRTAGTPCPDCGTAIEKISYLGGSCYLCPRCQA